MKKEKDIFYPEEEDYYEADKIAGKLSPFFKVACYASILLMMLMTAINTLI